MAKLEQGILGPFTGKVGTVVGYRWKGLPVVRGYRRAVRYPNTERQQEERSWFVQMVRFASVARGALLLGLREAAAREQMTEGNLFVKRNKDCFALDGRVDYERLVFACGSAGSASFEGYAVDDDGVLDVRFGRGIGRAQDRVYAYVYCPDLGQGLLSAPAERRDGRLRMALPDEWAGRGLVVYGFCVDACGQASRSAYVPPMEETVAGVAMQENEKGTSPVGLSLVSDGVTAVGVSVDPPLAGASWSSGRQSPRLRACGESA